MEIAGPRIFGVRACVRACVCVSVWVSITLGKVGLANLLGVPKAPEEEWTKTKKQRSMALCYYVRWHRKLRLSL